MIFMSKKECDKNLKKLDKSELKPVNGGYHLTVTTVNVILTGTLKRTGQSFVGKFPNVQTAVAFAEDNLLKEGEIQRHRPVNFNIPMVPGSPPLPSNKWHSGKKYKKCFSLCIRRRNCESI